MSITEQGDDSSKFSCLASLPPDAWRRGRTIHMPAQGAARAWICRDITTRLLAVLPNSRAARDLTADAEAMRSVCNIPPTLTLPEMTIASPSVAIDDTLREAQKAERGEVMSSWNDRGGILAATPGALMGAFSTGGDRLRVAVGESLSRSRLIEWLDSKGYERTDIVWSPGQFTYRGGIVDLFDPKDPFPIRIEFFDDDIETLRYFATDTQRSVRRLAHCEVHALSSRRASALSDLMPADAHIVMFEPVEIENAAENYEWLASGVDADDARDRSTPWNDVLAILRLYPRVRITAKLDGADIQSGITTPPNFRGRRRDAEAFCTSLDARGIDTTVVSNANSTERWAEAQRLAHTPGTISEGFVDAAAGRAFIGDLELTGVSLQAASGERTAPLDWVDRLTAGQWVVHEDYGVAKFLGSERIEGPDGVQEYLVLEYAGERRLKIPVMQFHKISRYAAIGGEEPTADTLSGKRWKKLSEHAREQAEEAARYLLEVYATRETSEGHAFASDDTQEREFDDTFPYKETDDQLTAIDDVRRDMSRAIPMDRLLIGDVGYGKTEVALRAAARCVFDGMQVALMAPTTLLAQQHFDTWRARFDQFGVRVEVVSRFVPAKMQKKIVADTADGKVDILIGTHRLIGSDVKFKSLGLVIVDEEHRFGVMHKERLKHIHPSVDVLMLSATPIPRSLHMSLSGLRDMSLLQTPPRARLPVITAVGAWSEELVKSAVAREKNRGGQIFYVHNRVRTIDREALTLRRMFPKLSIAVGHGQMSEKELKETMDRFAAGEVDMLVCTTIVESGLDIPRANTLIVSDAQDLGLAQMHQLRGRVGRRDEQAFALFLYPSDVKLTGEASERLEAIAAMGEFGAGYELARRDLEIRGGGELIGTAQHGTLGRVGFQRYCDLLEEAIRRAKGESTERADVEVAIPAAIPSDYLPHDDLRIALYRRILWAHDAGAIESLRDETIDRFGPLPRPLAFLFDTARARIIGPEFGVRKVACMPGETRVECADDGPLSETKKLPRGWVRRGGIFTGPGGLEALGVFLREMFIRS